MIAFGLSTLPWPLMLRPLGPAPAEAQTPPTLAHFHLNHLGSTEVMTQSTGTIWREIRYKAYGEVRLGDCSGDRYCHEFTGYDTEPVSDLERTRGHATTTRSLRSSSPTTRRGSLPIRTPTGHGIPSTARIRAERFGN